MTAGRSENSVRNSLFAIVGQAVSLGMGFVTRLVFVRVLGETVLGVNNIFYSVLSLLSLTELGLGSALNFALYKPIAERDDISTGKFMNLYARAYRIVAAAVFGIGLCLIPLLPWLTAKAPDVPHLTPVYLLFLLDSAGSYLFSYRRALVTASQNDWLNSLNLCLFGVLQNLVQLVLLLTTGSYLFYLAAKLVCTFLSNVSISFTAKRLFPALSGVRGLPEKSETAGILKNVKELFLNRFGSVVVTGTDNLLIGAQSVALVGIYSNYLLIVQTVQTVLTQVMNAVTASVGNLLAGDDTLKRRTVYRDLMFAACWLYGFSAAALDLLSTRFIALVFGANLVIPEMTVHLIALNFYLNGVRQPNLMYINAAGLFHDVRFKGIVEAAINLAASVLFLKLGLGLFGVLLGTTVSLFASSLWWEPWTVSRYFAGEDRASLGLFFLYNLAGFAALLAVRLTAGAVVGLLPVTAGGFIAAVFVTAILPNLLYLLIGFRTKEFGFFAGILKRMIRR